MYITISVYRMHVHCIYMYMYVLFMYIVYVHVCSVHVHCICTCMRWTGCCVGDQLYMYKFLLHVMYYYSGLQEQTRDSSGRTAD